MKHSNRRATERARATRHGSVQCRAAMRWIPAAVGLMVSASAFGQENVTGSASSATQAEQPAPAGRPARQPEPSLPAVTVNGARENPVNPPTTAGSKVPLTAREVPQSVTVVNAERIREQNLTTLEDAMMQATGVFVEKRDQERSIYYSRGLEIDTFMLDGVPTKYDWRNTVQPDLSMIERVEVLKGPSGLLAGAGKTGGAINLVRKRPTRETQIGGALSVGSWNNYRAEVDAGGALNADGTLRARITGAFQDKDSFIDKTNMRTSALYGVIEYDITPSTLVTVGASYQDSEGRQPWTLPAYFNPVTRQASLLDVPRSTYLGADWNRDHFYTTSAFAELEHKFNSGWQVKGALRYLNNRLNREQAYAYTPVIPGVNTTTLFAAKQTYTQEQTSFDLYANGPFSLFGRRHKALVGFNFSDSERRDPRYAISPFSQVVNIFNPRSDFAKPTFTPNGTGITTTTRQYGVYGDARFSLADPVTLVLGGRLSWWDISARQYTSTTSVTRGDDINAKFTPFAGLIYDFTEHWSAYASYAEIFQPQDEYLTASGNLVDPIKGKQYEVGVKGEFFEGALNTSLALFEVRETGRATLDNINTTNPSNPFFVSQGETKSQGFELEASGRITPSWTIYAGYTFNVTQDLQNRTGQVNTPFSAIAPKHLFKLWTMYRLPGDFNRWRIGGGMTAVSHVQNTALFPAPIGAVTLRRGGYATFDAAIGYDFNKHVSADLNLTNLFDRSYYSRINNPREGNIWGQPRAAMFTVRMKM
ncbi:TonB-dependent receptor [Cupriavidus necator]